jgi:ribosomal protein S14
MNLNTKYLVNTLLLTVLKRRFTQKRKLKRDFRKFYTLKKQVWKDEKKRLNFKKSEMIVKYSNMLYQQLILPKNVRNTFFTVLKQIRSFTRINIKNRCILCGQAHAVYKKFRLSRICIREQIRNNNINGILKL